MKCFYSISVALNVVSAPLLAQADMKPPMKDALSCLEGQSMDQEDVDIARCPPIPTLPEPSQLGDTGIEISLGAWELGTTKEGLTYKYGSLTKPEADTGSNRRLSFYQEEASTEVLDSNTSCWAKGYYRLKNILQNPPQEYLRLHKAGYQVRFFQFQTDLRNGPTGFKSIASYRDHLIKWVTVIDESGNFIQPTMTKFKVYLEKELERRGLSQSL